MLGDPFFYACAIPAILLFGMAKGGVGAGPGLLAVPLMSLAIPPVQAAAILLPLLVAMDAVALYFFRGSFSKKHLSIIIPGAVAGIVMGSLSFRYLSGDMIRILIGVIAVAFCLNYWLVKTATKRAGSNRLSGYFWGAVSGFTSFGIHAGSPPINIYLLPQKLEKMTFKGTATVFFAAVNVIKLIPYTWLGQFDSTNLLTALVLMPVVPIGVRLGFFVLQNISERTVYRVTYFFLFVVGSKLLIEGGAGILESVA